VYFHAQFDYFSEVNEGDSGSIGSVGIDECYFFVDELFGDIGGKVGAFALPFSMEHNGPFRTCNYTITPSALNSYWEQVRGYGFELTKTQDVKPEDIVWKFGVLSGTADPNVLFRARPLLNNWALWTDDHGYINNQGEYDDTFGYYVMVGKKPVRKNGIGWHVGYYDNGGDLDNADHADTYEVSGFQIGLEWSNDDLTVLFQYADGSWDFVGDDGDLTCYMLLVNYTIDEKQSVTLRYDTFGQDYSSGGGPDYDMNAITVAYNRKVTDNSMLQFEWLAPTDDTSGIPDCSDDLIQLRYKVHF
jgi:hypothetical protein